jgi:predicted nucleotidyltransferase
MTAIEHLTQFFRGEEEVVAAYLYGQPATERTWPDSDIEIALLFRETMESEAVSEYLEGLGSNVNGKNMASVPGAIFDSGCAAGVRGSLGGGPAGNRRP